MTTDVKRLGADELKRELHDGGEIALLDAREEGLFHAHRMSELGYTDVAVLDGGIIGWEAAGYRLDSGVHVPRRHSPRSSSTRLARHGSPRLTSRR